LNIECVFNKGKKKISIFYTASKKKKIISVQKSITFLGGSS
jgi:hypothetical protein